MTILRLRGQEVRVIAALHLPPMPSAANPGAVPISDVMAYAQRNASTAFENGVDGLYIQDLGDVPVAPQVRPHTIARLTAVGCALRRSFPRAPLGVCLMSHGADGPLAVAQAMDADFVRLKVFIGAMVKAEGLLEGCAHEAVEYRAAIGATSIAILADIYDRTGMPVAPVPLSEAAQQAVTFGRADGLILTGRSFDETERMVEDVRHVNLGVPLSIGGGVRAQNVAQALRLADAVIVSTALKRISSWTVDALGSDWDPDKVRAFVEAAREA
jgi:membrane complex biogenesis BtpA family protein